MLKTWVVQSNANNVPSHEAEFDQIEQEQTTLWHNPGRLMGAAPVKYLVCLVNAGGCHST